jgi:hypothetical protein
MVQGARVQGSFAVQGSGCGVLSSAYGVLGSAYGVRRTGFGVRGSGFGVRGSGFGVLTDQTRNPTHAEAVTPYRERTLHH